MCPGWTSGSVLQFTSMWPLQQDGPSSLYSVGSVPGQRDPRPKTADMLMVKAVQGRGYQ